MSKVLSWGKCKVTVTPIASTGYEGGTEAVTFDAIVENSTSFETAQGDKVEAKIEGGAIEAARFNSNTYTLTYQERIGSADEIRLDNHNGVVNGEFTVLITPENPAAKKIKIAKASANVQINFNTADGIIATYTFSSLDNGDDEQVTLE